MCFSADHCWSETSLPRLSSAQSLHAAIFYGAGLNTGGTNPFLLMRTSLFVAIVIVIRCVLHYTASVISVCKYLCSIVGDVFATNPAGRLDLVLTASFLGDSVRRRLQFPRAKGTYL